MSDPLRSRKPRDERTEETVSEPGSSRRLEATVRGRVQGVGFRWFVSRVASRLELDGWVSNRSDGSVQVVAEGPEPALESLLVALERGPQGAHVDRVDVRHGEATARLQGFEIRTGSHSGD